MSDEAKNGFDAEEAAEYFKLVAFVDAVHTVVEATSKDFAKSRAQNRAPTYSDATLNALGELTKRYKNAHNLLDKVQQSGQSYN